MEWAAFAAGVELRAADPRSDCRWPVGHSPWRLAGPDWGRAGCAVLAAAADGAFDLVSWHFSTGTFCYRQPAVF